MTQRDASPAARSWRGRVRPARPSPAARCGPRRRRPPAAPRRKRRAPIDHLVVSCQENRSFDHYFGYAPQVQARRLRPAARVHAARRGRRRTRAVRASPHSLGRPAARLERRARQYNGGKMDGFFHNAALRTGDGNNAIPYYTAKELPFYYGLFRRAGLCANYFCSLLGPTWPNRFYLMSGTSGGITTNGLWGYGIFDSATGRSSSTCSTTGDVSWKIYYIGFDGVPRSATPTTSLCSGAVGARPADHGNARRLPRGLPPRDAAERLLDHPQLLDAVRRAPGRGRQRRHGIPGADHQRAAPLAPLAQVRVLPHLRRARGLLRPCPPPQVDASASGSGCRSGSSRPSHGAVRSSRASRPITSRR